MPPGFAALVPAGLECEERALISRPATISAAEMASLGPVPNTRRNEFLVGRACARAALRRLGRGDAEVPRGPAGEPRWPSGTVGSITHAAGVCAAVVGHANLPVASIGIDVTHHGPLRERVARRLLSGSTWPHSDDRAAPDLHWDAVVFGAKEAVFKAWYPLVRTPLRFSDTRVSVRPDGTFGVEVEESAPARSRWRWRGRYAVHAGVVRTVVLMDGS